MARWLRYLVASPHTADGSTLEVSCFRSGNLSKPTGVAITGLRYHDELGLLCPAQWMNG